MKKLAAILVVSCFLFVPALRAQVQLDRAKELLKQGRAKDAIGLARQVLDQTARNVDAWQILAQGYLQISNLDSAKIAADRIISLDEKNLTGYLVSSQISQTRGDLKSAYSALAAGLMERKGDGELLIAQGSLLLRMDSVDRAIVALTAAKEALPNSAAIFDGLGDAYSRQGVPAFAITQYEKSVELDSMNAVIYKKLGNLYYKERRYNDAARSYARVVLLDPSNKEVLFDLIRMYMATRPKQYDNAAKYLKIYVQHYPDSNEAWGMYAEALFALRQFPDALDAAQHVLKIDPKNAKALRYVANSQFVLEKYKESADAFKELQAVDTLKVDDFIRLGDAYAKLKQNQAASAAYDEALRLDPDEKELYNKAASLLMSEQRWAEAATLFERRFMTDSSARALSAYLNYASCKILMKEYDSARVAYHTFISKRADYPLAWIGLARALLLTSTDSLQVASKAYQEWLKILPAADEGKYKKELAEAHKNIGVAFLVEKQYEKAIPEYFQPVDPVFQPFSCVLETGFMKRSFSARLPLSFVLMK